MKRLLLALGVLVIFGITLLLTFFGPVMIAALAPRDPFDADAAPIAPDYADAASWTALPGREDAADAAHPEFPAGDQTTAFVDVFYIHPTSYVGSDWNAPVDDPTLNEVTDRVATRIQASVFNACCAVYGPRYRQANLTAFLLPGADGASARDLAYADVAEAFRHFLARNSRGRPFIVASHSQGSVHARRLLREEVSGQGPREQLVAAYLIGVPFSTDAVERELPDIPPCRSPSQSGCLIVWNARAPGYQSPLEPRETTWSPPTSGEPDPRRGLCVNPLSWRQDEGAAGADQNRGAVFLETEPATFEPGFANARCQEGTLLVTELGSPPRDLMSRLLDAALGAGNHHPIEYQMFFLNLRRNAQERVDAYHELAHPSP